MEGPFINPASQGAHQADILRDFEGVTSLEEVYGTLEGVRIITLAPEITGGFDWISRIIKKNIIVSCGHSQSSFEDIQKASESGVKLVTHLFNAMTTFHHRASGIIGFALTSPHINYTIIADGIHLHPSVLSLAWRANPEGLILISDAMAALGLPDGIYRLGNMKVEVKHNRACIEGTSTLAGSIIGMDTAVRNLKAFTGCSIAEALEAASSKPAKILGIASSKGHLTEGADADFVVLDEELYVQATYVAGKLCYKKE